ncbi:MAG: helix-turn-helix transcriptional regulator [Paludibacteraceae bacterium]|nr:helix-turn-helix transcriptional regulator [Paludibacteraceae bacterium]
MDVRLNENERVQQVMQSEGLKLKEFAQQLGVSQAALSNVLNLKNKPSLDMMTKLLNRYGNISPDWLIRGVGSMYRQKNEQVQQMLFDIKPLDILPDADQNVSTPAAIAGLGTTSETNSTKKQDRQSMAAPQVIERRIEKHVTKVVVFFDDGTFQEL